MTLATAWQEMKDWMTEYAGPSAIVLILAFAAAVYLFVINRDVRKRLLIPILFFVPIVINPILYRFVFHDLRYWRLFWLLPDAVLIALAFVDLLQRVRPAWIKCLGLLAAGGVIALAGSNSFLQTDWFAPTDNYYKVSADTKEICDIILEQNPHPKCIFTDFAIRVQTRQYSGDIEQLFGRDANGFIMPMSPEAKQLLNEWNTEPKNWDALFRFGKEKDYPFICCKPPKAGLDDIAWEYDYFYLAQVGSRVIYYNWEGDL